MSRLTSRSLATGATLNDLIHIVITGDTTQNAAGSSYKATLSQLSPLFVSPNVYVTGGTANSTGGTITFTNSTGGTFTVTGATTPFSGGSGSCINNLYTNNVYACTDEITVYNRVQSDSSDAQSTLSFAFGRGVQALGDYTAAKGSFTIASGVTSHAEGTYTSAFGIYSHSEGNSSRTGTNNAYLATGLTSGVVYLSSTYGNVTSNFTNGEFIYINDENFSGSLLETYGKVSGTTFLAGQTLIYLYDTLTTTAGSCYVGDTKYPDQWGGDKVIGGQGANSKGFTTSAIGKYSLTSGQQTAGLGPYNLTTGKNNKVYGTSSLAIGTSNVVAGTTSFVFGDSNRVEGTQSTTFGTNNNIYSDKSFAGGSNNTTNGLSSFIYSRQSTINNAQGAILGGIFNFIQSGSTENGGIFGGQYNTIAGVTPSDPTQDSVIIGGSGNTVTYFNSAIIASERSMLTTDHSVILGGTNITGTTAETVYVPKIRLVTSGTPSGSADTQGEPGSLLWDNTYFYFKTNLGWRRISGSTF